MLVPPHIHYVEILTFHVILGGGALGDDQIVRMELSGLRFSTLVKETLQNSLTPFTM